MAEHIYTRVEGGGLEQLEEEPFATEPELQRLIAEHPELLDGEQIRPGDPRRWILITREKGIAETSDAGARWSVDHLIVDQDAVPTLIEVKRGSNPDIRRKIIGQMLEYAAHAAETWTADEIRRTFEKTVEKKNCEPDEVLGLLLRSDGEPDSDKFWENVATNLDAKRLRLLFISDSIPDPLERVVEFLNEQMPRIEVLAVEIKQFCGKSVQTLVPRVLGRIAGPFPRRGAGPRQKLTREAFLEAFENTVAQSAAKKILDVAQESGAILYAGAKGFVIRMGCSFRQEPVSVAWLYPPSVSGWMGLRNISFGSNILDSDLPQEVRVVLERWVEQFSADEFTTDSSGRGFKTWSVDYEAATPNIEVLGRRLTAVLAE